VATASQRRWRWQLQVLQAAAVTGVNEWTIGRGGVRGGSEAPSVAGFHANGENGEEGVLRGILNWVNENGEKQGPGTVHATERRGRGLVAMHGAQGTIWRAAEGPDARQCRQRCA
jgi:hypothetical protein